MSQSKEYHSIKEENVRLSKYYALFYLYIWIILTQSCCIIWVCLWFFFSFKAEELKKLKDIEEEQGTTQEVTF